MPRFVPKPIHCGFDLLPFGLPIPATLLQAEQHRGQRKIPVVEQGRLQIGRWDGVRDVRQPVPRQRLWLEVKLYEILHGARADPFIAAPLVVITIRRTHKSK